MQTLRVPFGSVNSHSSAARTLALLVALALFAQAAAPLPVGFAPQPALAAASALQPNDPHLANLLTEPASTTPQLSEALKKMPMNFTLNEGQTDARVQFTARGRGYNLFLTPTEAVMALNKAHAKRPTALRMQLLGANSNPVITGLDQLPTVSNYYVGNDPKRFREAVPHFAKVKYAQMYPGIDVVYYGNQQQLEYDFIVAPGADPNQIKMKFAGARKLRIADNGDLVIKINDGELRHHKPIIYQTINGARQEIAGQFVLRHRNQVSFALGEYDTTKELVIDPTLTYSTYLGGFEGDEKAYAVAVKSGCTGACETYITGFVTSLTFPDYNVPPVITGSSAGATDIFVAKLDATGSMINFYTFIGGSADEHGRGIKVDASGNSYVVGAIRSDFNSGATGLQPNDPVLNNDDGFIAKLSPAGLLTNFTYLAGSSYDQANAIVLNGTDVYVTGQTYSSNFPTQAAYDSTWNGGYDVFVCKYSLDLLTRSYSTFIGGGNMDFGNGIDLYNGCLYIVGNTQSTNFPVSSDAFDNKLTGFAPVDAFVVKLDPAVAGAGGLKYSTFLGGHGREYAYGIAVDKTVNLGEFYICGRSHSPGITAASYSATSNGFPITVGTAAQGTQAGVGDAFVTRFTAAGGIAYSTFLGGSDYDTAYGIAVSGTNVFLIGETDSSQAGIPFPITLGGYLQDDQLGTDAFIVKLNTAVPGLPGLLYSTYFGGGDTDWYDSTDSGRGLALAGTDLYIVGFTNSVSTAIGGSFPITPLPAVPFQENLAWGSDAFVARITF